MSNKAKSFWLNPWTVSIGSGLIILGITIIIDLVTAEKVFSTIGKILTSLWNAVLTFLNFEIKVWWLLIGIAFLILGLYLWIKYLDYKQPAAANPEFVQYTRDTILGYNWKWTWNKDLYGKYSIESLHPICDVCETPLTIDRAKLGSLKCLRCSRKFTKEIPSENDIKIMIRDNVRRKYFPNE